MSSVGTFHITIGDTLEPLCTVLKNGRGNPYDLSDYDEVRIEIRTEAEVVDLAATTVGVTAHPTQAFTANATTDRLSCEDHGVEADDHIVAATSGTLPTPLALATEYFPVEITPNSFKVATEPGGAAIDITGAGTGNHTFYVRGSVQVDFAAASVDTKGKYRLRFQLSDGGETTTVPADKDRYILLDIK